MHIPPYDNANRALVDVDDERVPLNYFNIVKLRRGEAFAYQVPRYETAIVPATGTIDVEVEGEGFERVGLRGVDVWDGEPEGVYVPSGAKARFVCVSEAAEVFVAGARYDKPLEPFVVRAADIDKVQYGSDDTKTHRKIKHILGTKYRDRVGRLLVSELFTVGQGGWSGFPPTSTTRTDRRSKPATTRPTISAFVQTTGSACNCFSARTVRLARPIISLTAPRWSSTKATTLASSRRATRCTISPSLAASANAR